MTAKKSTAETAELVDTAATKYCVYTVNKASTKLKPALAQDAWLCMPCTGDGKCRGKVNAALSQLLLDEKGNQERIQMTLRDEKCKACPKGGSKGYTFGSTGGDLY